MRVTRIQIFRVTFQNVILGFVVEELVPLYATGTSFCLVKMTLKGHRVV